MSQPRLFGGPAVRPCPPDPRAAHLAEALPGVRFGTSSWSFPGWAGQLWRDPVRAELLSSDGLSAYAAHPLLRTVSIDRTYYRLPEEGLLAGYAAQVPADFRFVVKAPAAVGSARLRGQDNPLALDPTYVEDAVVPRFAELGDRLGQVLLQLPPQDSRGFGDRFYHRLAAILAVPLPWTLEVRTPDWLTPSLAAVCRDTGAVPVLSLHPRLPDLRTQWRLLELARQPFLSIRWNLSGSRGYEDAKQAFAPFDRLVAPRPEERGQLAKAVRWAIERERPVWIIANNKAEGCAPLTLRLLAEAILAG